MRGTSEYCFHTWLTKKGRPTWYADSSSPQAAHKEKRNAVELSPGVSPLYFLVGTTDCTAPTSLPAPP